MAPLQVTENTYNTKTLPHYSMFSNGGLGVGDREVMRRSGARWRVLLTLRKHLMCYGICRERCDKVGEFSSVWKCVEIDILLLKALSFSGLEAMWSRTWKLGGKKPDYQTHRWSSPRERRANFLPFFLKLRSKYCFRFASMSYYFRVQAF